MATETPTGHTEMPYKTREQPELDDGLARLDIAKLTIRLTDTPKPLPDLEMIPFGATFSDHMAIASFHPVSGWSTPEITPYAPLTLDPASSCLQYGTTVYEGMKAYLGPDGKVRLFRPDMNMRRLERSVARLALPSIDGDAVLDLIKRLVQIEKRWIPTLPGHSVYIRPTIIGTRPALDITASDHAILYILLSPSRPYFQRPLSLLAVTDAVRAWPGGTGGHKFGGNYSPGFACMRDAAARGYDQVLWLFGEEREVTEAGLMNVFVVVRRANGDGLDVITPPLDGTILPGVTRASCLELVSDPAFHASISSTPTSSSTTTGTTLHATERTFTMSDLERWSATDALLEIFCVGTAAIVVAAHKIEFEGRVICVPTYSSEVSGNGNGNESGNGLGPVGKALREKIMAVQEGREEYEGWGVVCA